MPMTIKSTKWGKDHDTVWTSLQTQSHTAMSLYKNNYLLAKPDKLQALIINPRDVDAVNNDEDMYIDNQVIKKPKTN